MTRSIARFKLPQRSSLGLAIFHKSWPARLNLGPRRWGFLEWASLFADSRYASTAIELHSLYLFAARIATSERRAREANGVRSILLTIVPIPCFRPIKLGSSTRHRILNRAVVVARRGGGRGPSFRSLSVDPALGGRSLRRGWSVR